MTDDADERATGRLTIRVGGRTAGRVSAVLEEALSRLDEASCRSRRRVPGIKLRNALGGSEEGAFTVDCLLRAPHPGRLHYHAVAGDYRRFWTWTDEQGVCDGESP